VPSSLKYYLYLSILPFFECWKVYKGFRATYAPLQTSLMVWGCISAYGMGSLHVLEGTSNAERYIKFLEQHMLPSRQRLFQGRPWVFQQDNANPHTAAITTAWLRNSFETCSRHHIWNELILHLKLQHVSV